MAIMAKMAKDSIFGLPLLPPEPKRNSKVNVASQKLTKEANSRLASFSVREAQRELGRHSEKVWLQRGEKRALALFHAVAQHVPAYKKFLGKHGVHPQSIREIEDFKKVPITDKENYLHAYQIEELAWHGDLPTSQMISVSSGSSGKPFFWPRGQILDTETALVHELLLASFFELDRRSTLFVVCFAMGMYVAGPITMSSVLRMGQKGYPVTLVTPGYSPDDVLNVIPNLAPKYDQVILAGYPPYIKEIIDQGIERGIKWKDIHLRFLLAGEGFNESWRTYVGELAGHQSPIHDFINLYGSADAAVLAFETPATIIVRRRISEDLAASKALFDSERLPSFLQYLPEHKYFEVVNEELVFTAPGGIPLIRYNIHDSGGVLSRSDIEDAVPELREYFTELERERELWNLPFVYVFGKSDQTVVLYGANVYPENIRKALEEGGLRQYCTGKLMMYTDSDQNKNQRLHIEIECSKGTKLTQQLTDKVTRRILETLLEVNSEYRVVHQGIGDRTVPLVHLLPYGNDRFRSKLVKHRWTRKS